MLIPVGAPVLAVTRSSLLVSAQRNVYLPVVLSPGTVFSTLPPGSSLPSDAQCAALVKKRPENKAVNRGFNATPGSQRLPEDFFGSAVDPRANSVIAARVTGAYTGTTDEILQWAACKWGIDEDLVRAQAAIESWWRQTALGDWTADPSRCAPGRGIGVDGRPGECPESFGILQDRYPYQQGAWPGIAASTAYNADTAYAIWRACYEGYEWWLNDVDRGQQYASGDAWGCVGRWFAGRWHTQAAEEYTRRVREYYDTRIWETPNFQEP
jgi:autotransporter family porin